MNEENYCLQNPVDCLLSVGSATLDAQPVYQPTLGEYAEAFFTWGFGVLVTLAYLVI